MTEEERNTLRGVIAARISQLEQESAAAENLAEDITLDQQSVGRLSRMDAIQRRAMADATAQRRQAELQRLRKTLLDIDDEDFGYCTDCGEPIAMARLKINPTLTRCAECTRGA
ncbi:TraR/DksA family transcriptional regulator [Amaricoccus tamworthensis]|uniref:TraR/DksA family transcriptional regulator n=1 Tax=Amaricoccus tamworthensis TaxID=57002 RepID=UPI003C7BC40E